MINWYSEIYITHIWIDIDMITWRLKIFVISTENYDLTFIFETLMISKFGINWTFYRSLLQFDNFVFKKKIDKLSFTCSFKWVSFWLHSFCGLVGRLGSQWFNHTSWVAIVTSTDRPKAVRNRCVIEVFGRVFVLSHCFFILLRV